MEQFKLLFVLISCFPMLVHGQSAETGPGSKPPVLRALMNNPDPLKWKQYDSVPLSFNSFHTQGLLKIGDFFYLSAVEVRRWPRTYGRLIDGLDRDTGDGTGHLFKFDAKGNLVQQITLGEGSRYHPGGIDYDGNCIWVPVCEYRPNGSAILYRVDPNTMEAEKIDTCKDAIGAVAFDRQKRQLIGMNWDSQKFYRWHWNERTGRIKLKEVQNNSHHFIRYQDCFNIGEGYFLCSGLRGYTYVKEATLSRLNIGGLQALRFRDFAAVADIPVPVWKKEGIALNNNPFFAENTAQGVFLYFIPEDNQSNLYIYQLVP
ncbi:MAG: DUF6454 family protein [Candidatus Pseudobacter hemicellulosilyticus]|uniref:DUF6454 family protein n=1 Tax=Candidatus Pseudobacter hemicellulosilyticus TaxID=3121375 RepID=A0AAJ5WRS2_9BACT|nr:MAG: DUF6454 family protein [Pseudobacter sp.]